MGVGERGRGWGRVGEGGGVFKNSRVGCLYTTIISYGQSQSSTLGKKARVTTLQHRISEYPYHTKQETKFADLPDKYIFSISMAITKPMQRQENIKRSNQTANSSEGKR